MRPQQADQQPVISVVPHRPELSEAEWRRLVGAAGRRVVAVVCGQPAESMDEALTGFADRPVLGAFVSLKRGGQLRACCGYLGNTVRLAEAMAHAASRAARDDPRFAPISPNELNQLDMDVWVLWNLEPVPGQARDRLHGFEIGKHGLQISSGSSRGLLLPSVAVDHGLDAEGFLSQVCLKAGLAPDAWLDDTATLMRFEGEVFRGRLELGAATEEGRTFRPHNGTVRDPAVAGQFYPGDPAELDRALDGLLSGPSEPEDWAAALVPHAGWMYSGRLAADVWSRVRIPRRVVVLCPKHRPGGAAWAVAPHARWILPGRSVDSDPELARGLAQAVDGLELDPVPHRQEHAIEVQLPFIARLAPSSRVLGVTIYGGDLPALQRFALEMADYLRELPETPLLVISSDMNHFSDDRQTRRLDQMALEALESLDPVRLYDTVTENGISMCGVLPAVIVLEALRRLGTAGCCEVVGYATSAEVSGDQSRTVGYAGALFR